jgi:pSer/pThr/pTyr-binding forkhead associated (FHA) protein
MAGTSWMARRFPVRIGRGPECDLKLDDPGVWDQHLLLQLHRAAGFSLKTAPNALAQVNGQPISEISLRNGDCIELGAVRIQFWLAPVRPGSLGLRQALTWGMIAAAVLSQIAILYYLLQ